MLGESVKFFGRPTTKRQTFKFFSKLNGNHILIANFSKLCKYQTFGLIELHNLSKGQLIEYSSYEKTMFTITGASNVQLLKFWLFNFPNFHITFFKNFMKRLPGFKIDFESTDKVLPLHQYLWSKISRQWNNGPLIFLFFFFYFWNLHGRAFQKSVIK